MLWSSHEARVFQTSVSRIVVEASLRFGLDGLVVLKGSGSSSVILRHALLHCKHFQQMNLYTVVVFEIYKLWGSSGVVR